MRVIVGLGNPGPRYADTRHNIGFRVADELGTGVGRWKVQDDAESTLALVADEEVLLVKPRSYMNRSGDVVLALRQRLAFEPEDVLVVYDDFRLEFGRLRMRRSGSDGGHNGLASVLERLETEAVPRLRLGIGPVAPDVDDIDFVLAPFAGGEDVAGLVARGCAATRCWLAEGAEAAMNRFNGVPPL